MGKSKKGRKSVMKTIVLVLLVMMSLAVTDCYATSTQVSDGVYVRQTIYAGESSNFDFWADLKNTTSSSITYDNICVAGTTTSDAHIADIYCTGAKTIAANATYRIGANQTYTLGSKFPAGSYRIRINLYTQSNWYLATPQAGKNNPGGFTVINRPQAVCDYSHRNLCTASNCSSAGGGYWYNNTCNATVQPAVCDSSHLSLCNSLNCGSAGGYWSNGSCSSTAPATCSLVNRNLCTDQLSCVLTGGGYWYNNTCNSSPAPDTCDYNHLYLCNSSNCSSSGGGYWYNNSCNGSPAAPVCDSSHLNLCASGNCGSAGGYWYDNSCNSIAAPSCDMLHRNLCTTQLSCTLSGYGYWYNDTCNNNPEPKTYSWATGSYGACSIGTCGTGTKSRSVQCKDDATGSVVIDSYCTAAKPAATATCTETIGCVDATASIPDGKAKQYWLELKNQGYDFGNYLGCQTALKNTGKCADYLSFQKGSVVYESANGQLYWNNKASVTNKQFTQLVFPRQHGAYAYNSLDFTWLALVDEAKKVSTVFYVQLADSHNFNSDEIFFDSSKVGGYAGDEGHLKISPEIAKRYLAGRFGKIINARVVAINRNTGKTETVSNHVEFVVFDGKQAAPSMTSLFIDAAYTGKMAKAVAYSVYGASPRTAGKDILSGLSVFADATVVITTSALAAMVAEVAATPTALYVTTLAFSPAAGASAVVFVGGSDSRNGSVSWLRYFLQR